MDWLYWLGESFVTRNHCGVWPQWLITVSQLSNFLVFIAYVSIPYSLYLLIRLLRKVPPQNIDIGQVIKKHRGILFMFILFILSCGLTHLMDVLSFTWAPYRLFTLIDVITAIASVPTAFVLPSVIRDITIREVEKA